MAEATVQRISGVRVWWWVGGLGNVRSGIVNLGWLIDRKVPMNKCGYCGHNNEDSAARCSGCGKVLEARPAVKGGGDLKDEGLDPVIVGAFENTEHAGV